MARIGVIGAGIVGSAVAAWLLAERHHVTVFERDASGLPASSGNAGLIALPEIAPIASPGVLASVPRWLMDPLGPLTVRWRDSPALARWLVAFLAAARPACVAHARRTLGRLMATALADHQSLAQRAGIRDHLRQSGFLSVCERPRSLEAASKEASEVRSELGYDYEVLDAAAVRRRVPMLEGAFAGAVHMPAYWMVDDPHELLKSLRGVIALSGALIPVEATTLLPEADGVTITTADGRHRTFNKIVVAGGVWSRDLLRSIGLRVLLETERGYNTTFPGLGWQLPVPIGFREHGFVATPLAGGLRVGGAVELARPDSPANNARAAAMRRKMRKFVPALPEHGGVEWMGRRPSTPDSLPVISRHPRDARLLFAFGHGHLGLTLSAVTARLIAELVEDPSDRAELAPFDIARFN